MNAVNPIEPSESIDFQVQNQLIVLFCSSKSCSQLETGYKDTSLLHIIVQKVSFRMPHWAALRDSDEHLPFVGYCSPTHPPPSPPPSPLPWMITWHGVFNSP